MTEIKGFVMTLIAVSVGVSLVDGFIPSGNLKKYVKYMMSLLILLALLTPVKSIITIFGSAISSEKLYHDVDAVSVGANSIVAMHIEQALKEKFSLDDTEVRVVYDGERIHVSAHGGVGLFESDFKIYIANNYGVDAEVVFYE